MSTATVPAPRPSAARPRPSRAMWVRDWAFPVPPVRREVLSAVPTDDTGRPPLLFVPHTCAEDVRPWLDSAAERGFPAYAVSLRGRGGSAAPPRPWRVTLRDLAHDVVQAAIRVERRPVLVGDGLGALAVQRALARYPARAAVLLTDQSPTGGAPPLVRVGRWLPRPFPPPLARPPVLVVGGSGDRLAARYGTDAVRPDGTPLDVVLDWAERL